MLRARKKMTSGCSASPMSKPQRASRGFNRLWLVMGMAAFLTGCYRDEWRGFVYPSRNDLLVHREIGTYSSLEECRSAANAVIQNAGWKNADYECGLNCELSSSGSGLNICEKTER